MEHFWVCPLQREPSAAKYSSCRKYVKGSCAVFATARQACAQSLWLCRNWRKEELLRYFLYPFWFLILIFGIVFDCICASTAPTYYITSASLSYLVMLLKLFGSFFKVMEILLGNRARITRARVAERATGLLASPSSCPGLPCCSLGYVPWIGIPAGWSDSPINLLRG